jgi:hypothetical protein
VVRSRVIRSTTPTPRNLAPTSFGPGPQFQEGTWQAEPELGPELSMPE